MAINSPAWLLANSFTKQTADEFGAVKGAPCTVGNVSYDSDGNTIVELVWTNSSGVKKTSEMKVNAGRGVKSVAIDASEHLILTMTDDTTIDAGEIPKPDLSDYAKKTDIPTKVEDLSDAADYAKKSEIPEGSVVDDALSETSKNPVQNKIVTAELKKKVDAEDDKGLSTNDYDDAAKAEVAKIKDKVDAETGKSLVSDTDIAQITANKDAIDILNGDASTAGSVDKKLADAIAVLNKLEKKIINHVPTVEEAKDNILYLVESETSGTYNQYMLIDGTIASLGSTEVDLDGYAKTEDVVLLQQSLADKGKSLIVGEDGKVIVGNAQIDIVTEFGETPSDEKVPSEKLVKDILDTKADSAIVTGHTNLDTGSDLNTLVDYGTYRTTTKRIDRIDNVPVQVAGMLEVRLTGGVIYHTYKTIDDEMYIRSSEDTGATWADWKKIATAEDLANYVAIQHKAEDKGKALVVGEDGKLILGEVATDGLEIVDKKQADFDALTEEEKNDPTKLYNITDAEAEDLSKYATKEYVNNTVGENIKIIQVVIADIPMSGTAGKYYTTINFTDKVPDGYFPISFFEKGIWDETLNFVLNINENTRMFRLDIKSSISAVTMSNASPLNIVCMKMFS